LLTERMTSPNQVTDYYLATLARQHKLSLATFDKQMSMAFPDEPGLVRLVS
jgi:predicted nucleic acid-binding protein